MKIFGWILNNWLLNQLYGKENNEQTMINKMHGLAILLLFGLAVALGIFFHEFNQYKVEWRQMTIQDHESYQEAIKQWYKQLDSTRTEK